MKKKFIKPTVKFVTVESGHFLAGSEDVCGFDNDECNQDNYCSSQCASEVVKCDTESCTGQSGHAKANFGSSLWAD